MSLFLANIQTVRRKLVLQIGVGLALPPHATLHGQSRAKDRRPSIPPERLLKASLPIARYSVRSERAFPRSHVFGYDVRPASIPRAQATTAAAWAPGPARQTTFEVHDARSIPTLDEAGDGEAPAIFEGAGFGHVRCAVETAWYRVFEVTR